MKKCKEYFDLKENRKTYRGICGEDGLCEECRESENHEEVKE